MPFLQSAVSTSLEAEVTAAIYMRQPHRGGNMRLVARELYRSMLKMSELVTLP